MNEILDKQVLSMVLICLRHQFDHNVLDQYFDSLKHNKCPSGEMKGRKVKSGWYPD